MCERVQGDKLDGSQADNALWDDYYTSESSDEIFWHHERDIPRLAQKYNVDNAFGRFIWRCTEHPVRTYELIDSIDGLRILEIGCGEGGFSAGLIMRNHEQQFIFYAIDYSPVALMHTEQKLRRLGIQDRCLLGTADAMNLPFRDNAFDVVVAPSVIEHISDHTKVIAELSRVCASGGRIVISTDNVYGWPASISLHLVFVIGGKVLRALGILHRPPILVKESDPEVLSTSFSECGVDMETIEFTHFATPFFGGFLKAVGWLPHALQSVVLSILQFLEDWSRHSTKGRLHPMFIYVGRRR